MVSSVVDTQQFSDLLKEYSAKLPEVGDLVKDQFLMMEGLKGIIVGGPGPTKYDFVEGGYITNEVKNTEECKNSYREHWKDMARDGG